MLNLGHRFWSFTPGRMFSRSKSPYLIPYRTVMVAQPRMMMILRAHAMYLHQIGRNIRLGLFDLALSRASKRERYR